MAINPDIRDSAYQFFIEEAPELLQIIEVSLLTLRQEYSTVKVHNLMRAAHSLKGGAASVELDAIATLAHRLETIVKALYSDTLEIDTELESQFLQAYDCLRLPLIEQIQTGSFDREHALTIAEPIFSQIEERLGDAFTQSDSYIPSSAELGVDMTLSIFEVDVAQGLEHLEAVIANPAEYEVAGEIRAQAEVFAGFAEFLNQPGFEAIAKTTLAALQAHPDHALVIGQLALTDFQLYRLAVLEDTIHTQELNPSTALIALANSTDQKGDEELGSWGVGEIFEQTFPPVTPSQAPEFIQGEQKISDWSGAFSPQTIDTSLFQAPGLSDEVSPDFPPTPEGTPTPSLAQFPNYYSDLPTAESIVGLDRSVEDTENPIPSLEDIFGSAPATSDTKLGSNVLLTGMGAEGAGGAEEVVSLTATWYEVENTEVAQEEPFKLTGWRGAVPSAGEEVFTNISQKNSPPASPDFPSLEASDTPDSEIIEVQWVAEATVVPEEAVAEFPSLEEVFGSAFATFETEDSVSSSIVPVTPTSNSLQEQELHLDEVEYAEVPETLEVAVKSIEQIFDDLPPIQASSTLTSKLKSGDSTANKPSAASKGKASSTSLSVRVDLERLERVNNLVGELSINRNGLSLQNEELQGSVRELLNRFAKVQNMVGNLQQLSDQMVVGASVGSQWTEELKVGRLKVGTLNTESFKKNLQPSNPQPSNPQPSNPQPSNLQPSNLQPATLNEQLTTDNSPFDSLELDSYGALHSRLQELLEEMMQLEESVDDIVLFAKTSDQTLEQQRQMVTQLRDELMWVRMLPLGEVINRFPRVLRDLSTTHHKPVSLKLSGSSVLVDKAVLEKLYDPLLHLLRNAFDHGIEFPEIRRQQGKTEEGQIEIRAYHRGSQTIIEVKDDGQGLNTERIGRRAVELGLLSAEQLAVTPHNQLFEFVFEPGFSTASQVSELSGRGVGLDVVRSHLRSLKGTITVTSSPGKGATFTLRLPLTLSVAKLLVCFVGSSALALPSDSIEEIVIPKSDQIKTSGTQQFLHWRGQIVPTYQLADLLSYACPMPETSPSKALISVPSPKNWALPMLVLKQEQQFFALEIERLVTEQELVIKPFGEAIAPPSCTYGCTILGDGSLIPVIDAALLLEQLLEEPTAVTTTTTGFNHRQAIESQDASAAKENSSLSRSPAAIATALGAGLIGTNRTSRTTDRAKSTPTVLVVDDAVALRRTLALTLERAGCRVLQARDGREAIERLQQTSSVNLVVCDIEMPNMNGFEFLSQRRQEPEILKIPIVMLTSRSSDKHRWLAMQLGATAYFTKPYLERDFVTAIKNIIGQFEGVRR